MAIGDNAIRRLTVIATDQGLTALNTKMLENDRLANQVAASHTRMAAATEAADRRMAMIHRNMNARSAVGSLGGVSVGGAVGAVAGYAAMGAGAIATIAAMNAVYQRGAELLEQYANAQRLVDRADLQSNLDELTKLQTDKISAQQVLYATELGARLQDANWQIEKFFKTSLDITNPALKLQAAWVSIVEGVAKATGYADVLIDKLSKVPSWAWGLAAGSLPVAGPLIAAARPAYDYLAGEVPAAPTPDQSLAAARGRLGAALEVSYVGKEGAPKDFHSVAGMFNDAITQIDKVNKGLKEQETAANQTRTAWDRIQESLGKSISVQEAEVNAVGKTAGEHARLRAEAQLLEAGIRSGMTEAAVRASDAYKTLGERAEKAADALARARLQNDINFERDQFGRNDTDRAVASRLRGGGLPVDMESQEAQDIRINRALEIKKQLTDRDPFIQLQGEMESLSSLLNRGAMDWDTYAAAAQRAQANTVAGMFGLGSQLATALGTIFNEQKAGAYAAAVLNTAESITKTMAQYGATPWGLAAAAVAAANGAAQIATISRQSRKGGGGAPSASSGGAAAAPASAPAAPQPRAVHINLQGRWHSTDQVRELIEQINEYVGDGGTKLYLQ